VFVGHKWKHALVDAEEPRTLLQLCKTKQKQFVSVTNVSYCSRLSTSALVFSFSAVVKDLFFFPFSCLLLCHHAHAVLLQQKCCVPTTHHCIPLGKVSLFTLGQQNEEKGKAQRALANTVNE